MDCHEFQVTIVTFGMDGNGAGIYKFHLCTKSLRG